MLTFMSRLVNDSILARPTRARVVLVVERHHVVSWLGRISSLLNRINPSLPDLRRWERRGTISWAIIGSDGVQAHPLDQIARARFYLFDKESDSTFLRRGDVVDRLNSRRNCIACLTSKRGVENYLHAQAIAAACGVQVDIDDQSKIDDMVAQAIFSKHHPSSSWANLRTRAKKLMRERARKRLCSDAVDHMTPGMLAERDLHGEISHWLSSISELAGDGR